MDINLWLFLSGMSDGDAMHYFNIGDQSFYDIKSHGKKPSYRIAKIIITKTRHSIGWEDLGYTYKEIKPSDKTAWYRYKEKREALKVMDALFKPDTKTIEAKKDEKN